MALTDRDYAPPQTVDEALAIVAAAKTRLRPILMTTMT